MAEIDNAPIKPNGRFPFREKIFAMGCLTSIAIGALIKLPNPENVNKWLAERSDRYEVYGRYVPD
jgi:hypothetical protein